MPETVLKLVHTLPDGQVQEFLLSGGGATLGRGSVNDIVLDDPKVSRIHARVETNGETVLQDLGSTNGTYVNGVRVTSAKLMPGDGILLGEAALRFEQGPPPSVDMETLDSQRDLDATLIGGAVPTVIRDTHLPRLAVHTGARTWEVDLNTDALTIGRGADSDIRLEDRAVSREHARLERRGSRFVIRDLGSANGTHVNGRKVDEHALGAGETVQIGAAQLVFMPGLDPDALTVVDAVLAANRARRPVVLIPGAMGSELWRGSERVWPNVKYMFTEPDIFRLPEARPLEPGGPIRELVIVPNFIKLERYSRLMEYLEESLGYETGKDLLAFGYDWRQDIRTAARRLARAIEEWDPAGPVTIIAHSMGCLVARYYVERLGGKSRVERLVLLGGPHGGCPKVACAITRGNLLPLGIMGDRLRHILSTFPSLYQVLPTAACVVDQQGRPIKMLEDEGWLSHQELRALLGTARDFRRELPARSSVPCVSVIGYGMKTLTRFKIRRSPKGSWEEIGPLSELAGDDTIPESSAIVDGSDVHPVRQHHSSLFVDNDVKMRLKLELTRPARGRGR